MKTIWKNGENCKELVIQSVMRVLMIHLAIILLGSVSALAQCEVWQQRADFGGPTRNEAIGFSIGTKGYVTTGSVPVNYKDLWEYNQTTDTWSQKADFGGSARWGCVAFVLDSSGYVGTGYDGTYKNDFWKYDPGINIWSQITAFPGSARRAAVGMSINGKGYVGGGTTGTRVKDFWEYDAQLDQWTQKADYGGGNTSNATGFGLSGMGYFGTGENNGGVTNQFWQYDPMTNLWVKVADFGGSVRLDASSFVIGGKGYVGVGNSSGLTDDFWEYDPITDTWTEKQIYGGGARKEAISFSIDSVGYIGLGTDGSGLSGFWEYDPDYKVSIPGGIVGQANAYEFEQLPYAVSYEAGISYSWSVAGGAQVSGGLSNSIDILWSTSGTGTIEVYGTDSASGCISDTLYLSVSVGLVSGYGARVKPSYCQIWPNPSSGIFDLTCSYPTVRAKKIKVRNLIGQVLYEIDGFDEERRSLDLSDFSDGIYFIQIEGEDESIILKLVKN